MNMFYDILIGVGIWAALAFVQIAIVVGGTRR